MNDGLPEAKETIPGPGQIPAQPQPNPKMTAPKINRLSMSFLVGR